MSDVIKHNHSVDIVKGWGIIAVMLGHIFLGSAEENIPRYLIYAFHMPLFFFVSGYLLNTEKLGTLSLSQYIRKYAKRMLGWWFVAWVVYTVSVNLMYSGRVIADYESTLHFIIRNIIYPWGHLWFVPGLFVTITFAYCINRFLRLNKDKMIALLLFISLVQMILSYSGVLPNTSVIRYHNLLFFSLGIVCKRLIISEIWGVVPLYFLVLLMTKYFVVDDDNLSMCNFAALLGFIIFGIAPLIQNDSLKSFAMMEWLGCNSLQIYLWHELPAIGLKCYFEDNLIIYYSVNFAWFTILLFVAYRCSLSKHSLDGSW